MDLKGIILSEKTWIPKGYILYDSIYVTFYIKMYKDGEHVTGCQGFGMVDGGGCSHRGVT